MTLDRLARRVWAEALSSPESCAGLIETLEALLPACKGADRVNILKAIDGLRTYSATMFPEDVTDQPTTVH